MGLPLYTERPVLPVAQVEPLGIDRDCQRCDLSTRRVKGGRRVRTVCMGAEGQPGGLLVVGEGPAEPDDNAGRPFTGKSGVLVRRAIQTHWDGPVAYDNATRCFPGIALEVGHVSACRPYLAQTIQEVKPTRIIALGGLASFAFSGDSMPMLSLRGAYTWLGDVPVFFVIHPTAALRNRIVRRWWDEDMQRALTRPVPESPPYNATCDVVRTVDDALAAVDYLHDKSTDGAMLSFDVETFGAMFRQNFRVVSLAISAEDDDHAFVWSREALRDVKVRAPMLDLLRDDKVAKCGQNGKFDAVAVFADFGVHVGGYRGDTRLWRKLMHTDAAADLDTLAYLSGMGGIKAEVEEEIAKLRKMTRKPNDLRRYVDPGAVELVDDAVLAINDGEPYKRYLYGLLPERVLYPYNALDAVATSRVASHIEPELREDAQLARVWDVLAGPANNAIARMEAWGIACDRDAVDTFDSFLSGLIKEAEVTLATYEFNPNSSKSVRELLFDKLNLPVMHTTKTGTPSTDKKTLEALKGKHPVVDAMLDHRRLTKLHGTYAAGMRGHIRDDGRVHPTFNVDGAGTGRLSCEQPNLQNIPRPSASSEAKMSRDCFVAPRGKVLLQADYSQLELRVAAMLSGDEKMKEIFASGVDYHQRTAEMIAPLVWKMKPENVGKKERSEAKPFNFGILYGMGDEELASRAKCTVKQAAAIRKAILGEFHVLASWIKDRLRQSQQDGFACTWWAGEPARRRSLWKIADADSAARSVAEHSSWNSPIQGTASDFCLASLVECVNWIVKSGIEDDVKLVCSVHDSLIFEVREDLVPMVAKTVNDIMMSWDSAGVPLEVDFELGKSWGSLAAYKLPS